MVWEGVGVDVVERGCVSGCGGFCGCGRGWVGLWGGGGCISWECGFWAQGESAGRFRLWVSR